MQCKRVIFSIIFVFFKPLSICRSCFNISLLYRVSFWHISVLCFPQLQNNITLLLSNLSQEKKIWVLCALFWKSIMKVLDMARYLRPQPRYSVWATPFGVGRDKTELILLAWFNNIQSFQDKLGVKLISYTIGLKGWSLQWLVNSLFRSIQFKVFATGKRPKFSWTKSSIIIFLVSWWGVYL